MSAAVYLLLPRVRRARRRGIRRAAAGLALIAHGLAADSHRVW